MKRSRIEIARSVQRLQFDGELVPVAELESLAGVPPWVLTRWIIGGKAGCHLDGVHDPKRGWLSSRAAVRRLQKKLWAKEAERQQTSQSEEV